jgi:hypothetical protein
MPKIMLSGQAQLEFAALDKSAKLVFAKRLVKLESAPPRKHLKGGGGYSVDEVGQGRIICQQKGEELLVLHVFATHKEYERWYRGEV